MANKQAGEKADFPVFSSLKLHQFVSLGLGVILNAPESWEDASSEELFQVIDPATGAQFTASGYENPGVSLPQWAEARLSAVAKGMPFLREVKAPCEMKGVAWTGIVAEYLGIFPESEYESHYLVLCLQSDRVVISFTITAHVEIFAEHEPLYRWLLQNQLDLYQVKKISNDPQGLAQLHQLAEQGDAGAQFYLATLYEAGQGVPPDEELAAEWYRKAAGQGHPNAQFNLGVYYANGQGVPQNLHQAIDWWRKAAEQGSADAQYYLAVAHANGMGVMRDLEQAAFWCRQAADQGHEEARDQMAIFRS